MDTWILILFIIVLISITITLIIRKYVLFITQVSSHSMLPTLESDERLVTFRIHNTKPLRRGDIVVFNSREKQIVMIKRLIGLPGDKVQILDNGDVLINGKKQIEAYVTYKGGKGSTFHVPENEYFFLGDNRAGFNDSRHWEQPTIPAKDLIGLKKR